VHHVLRATRYGIFRARTSLITAPDFTKADVRFNMSPDKVVRAENKDKLQAMKDYATNTIMCRRKMILEYFEEQYDPFNCGNCDNCMAILNNSNHSMQDFTEVRLNHSCNAF
jgi:superfamily II DNA helicase RecQ